MRRQDTPNRENLQRVEALFLIDPQSGTPKALGFGETLFKESAMNKKHSLYFGVAVLLLAAIFTLAGCGDDGGGGTTTETFTSSAAGKTYILVISGGNSYTLTIRDDTSGAEQKSAGDATLSEGGVYSLTSDNEGAVPFMVSTTGNGISGIIGNIPLEGGGSAAAPTGQLSPAKTITITGLAQYASAGIKGNALVTLYDSSPNYPIAAGYATIQGNEATAALKSIPSGFESNEDLSLGEAVNLIKSLPNAWTGSGSYYILLWANVGMATSYNRMSFTTANTSVPVSESTFNF
jgi:hypothetical protein